MHSVVLYRVLFSLPIFQILQSSSPPCLPLPTNNNNSIRSSGTREKQLGDETCSPVSSLIASRRLPTAALSAFSEGYSQPRVPCGSNLSSGQREMTQYHREGSRERGETPAAAAYVCKSARCVYLHRRPHRTPISSLARHTRKQTRASVRTATRPPYG